MREVVYSQVSIRNTLPSYEGDLVLKP